MAINYALMKRRMPSLKAALTRAKNSGDPAKVEAACREAIKVWDEAGAWPDNWHTWNVALRDATGQEMDDLYV